MQEPAKNVPKIPMKGAPIIYALPINSAAPRAMQESIPGISAPLLREKTIICTIAILAAIESLLSCVVSDKMVCDKHNSNTELIAQGAGNICSGLFGGIPATGAIARTAANVKNGGRTPVAGMVHAVVILLFLVALMPVAKLIPMPVIAAILFIVAYNMSEWREFVSICKTKKIGDIVVLLITFLLTVILNLVVAIFAGGILTLLFYIIHKLKSKETKDENDET